MQAQKSFAWQSFVAILVVVALLLIAVYLLVPAAFETSTQVIIVAVAGLLAALILWVIVRSLGNGLVSGVRAEVSAQAAAVTQTASASQPTTPAITPPPVPASDSRAVEAGAIQMLAILQREGRLVDFLQEDLSPFDDAQIGAAVRSVHAGCKQALDEHVQLEAIYTQPEGSMVTVEPGFDAYAVRLSGNVSGEPPFTGRLQHSGWRASGIELPTQVDAQRDDKIVAAAEVEVA
jgi:hypothetical protein